MPRKAVVKMEGATITGKALTAKLDAHYTNLFNALKVVKNLARDVDVVTYLIEREVARLEGKEKEIFNSLLTLWGATTAATKENKEPVESK